MAMKCINGVSECCGCMSCQEYNEHILRCDDCNGEICYGDDYYDIDDHVICSDCINNYWKVK